MDTHIYIPHSFPYCEFPKYHLGVMKWRRSFNPLVAETSRRLLRLDHKLEFFSLDKDSKRLFIKSAYFDLFKKPKSKLFQGFYGVNKRLYTKLNLAILILEYFVFNFRVDETQPAAYNSWREWFCYLHEFFHWKAWNEIIRPFIFLLLIYFTANNTLLFVGLFFIVYNLKCNLIHSYRYSGGNEFW